MKRIARLALALALALAAAPATAQVTTAVVHRVERAERGDTTSLTFHVRGPTTALLSEPFVLADRTRLYLDVDGVTAAPDSAALARLAGDNIVALAPRIRTGGTAVAIDVRALAGYTIAQDDSTITVRIAKAHQAAAEAAHVPAAQPPAATAAPKPWTLERLRQLPLPAGKALLAFALALLLLLAGARAWTRRRARCLPSRSVRMAASGPRARSTPRARASRRSRAGRDSRARPCSSCARPGPRRNLPLPAGTSARKPPARPTRRRDRA